jgi:hypothetical protein
MKKNMGIIDRTIRILAAILAAYLIYTNVITGALAVVLGILAVVFVLTSIIGFCPAYFPLGLRTCSGKDQ